MSSDSNTVSCNTISGNSDDGIFIYHSYGNEIRNNLIIRNGYKGSDPTLQNGIYLVNQYSGANTEITENIITQNKYAGVLLDGSSVADIHFNSITNNRKYGLENTGTGAVNAQNNWWGSNKNPTTGSHPQVINIGTGTVNVVPWLKRPHHRH